MDGSNGTACKVTPLKKFVLAKILTKKVTEEFWSGTAREGHTPSAGDKIIPALMEESLVIPVLRYYHGFRAFDNLTESSWEDHDKSRPR